MSYLGDFNNLHLDFRSSIIGIVSQSIIWYLDIYFLRHDFFVLAPFQIPIILSVGLSFINVLIALMLFSIADTPTKSHRPEDKDNDANIEKVNSVIYAVSSAISTILLMITSGICYWFELSIYVCFWTTITITVILFIVNYFASDDKGI